MTGAGSEEDPAALPRRRSSHIEHEVAYAAVGASAAADLMEFPPDGSTPYEIELKLGSGADRFLAASSLLMTWSAQRGAGISVEDIEIGDGGRYTGVDFDAEGLPLPPEPADTKYGRDGEPFLTSGTVATLRWPKDRAVRRIRVVYTVDEARRAGFAWGTTDSEGAVGEQLLTVAHRDDDTVWATARGFLWGTASGKIRHRGKAGVKFLTGEARAQLTALGPGAQAGAADEDAAKTER